MVKPQPEAANIVAWRKWQKAHNAKWAAMARKQVRPALPLQRQAKAKPASSMQRADNAIENSKKPRVIKIEGEQQKTAAAGDTIPIVFGKRANDVGGVWVQPSLSKQNSYNFVGIFLYPLSQGEVVSTPVVTNTYVGPQQLNSKASVPTVNKYYSSASAMAASPSSCPITSGKIFCDYDSNYYIGEVHKASGYTQLGRDFENFHNDNAFLTIGIGDTSNSVILFSGDNYQAWDSVTGQDLTATYFTSLGVSNPANYNFTVNRNPRGGTLIGGFTVGTIDRGIVLSGGVLGDLFTPTSNATLYAPWNTSNPVNQKFSNGTVDNQYNSSNPASTGTLGGQVAEYAASPVADPTNPGSGYDFTDFADITWLEIQGSIYDESNPASGEYKLTTRQISTFIEQGVKVALYSAGTPGTTGASNQFVDLAMHLFALIGRVDGSNTADIASPIDTSNLQDLATFCTNTGLFFNGVIDQSVNIIDYISTIAPFYLLQFVSENGRYAFKPVLPLTSGNEIDGTALTPSATFNESNILPGSYKKTYDPADNRRDVQLSLAFRDSEVERVGIQKTRTVRYATVSNDAPTEQFDMTDGCTSTAHTDVYAKYELARRKHSTHTIFFETSLLTTDLTILDVIKVQRQRINSAGDDRTETDHYQITSITHGTDGVSAIEAMHFPLNASNVSLICDDILNGSFTVI
jgi:hypothetical protein